MGVTLAPLALLLTVALAAAGAADPGSNASDEIGALACASIHPAVVVYNRVPKAASSTMLALLHAQHIKGLLTWVFVSLVLHKDAPTSIYIYIYL
eukprot:m.92197 g.92197  ORF g.92197 m.92197 type:complete len:95 (+) comp8503_c0_seq3:89-373(+)